MRMSRIRIKDVARLANVSTGTVDRVIHRREGVSEATRRKVQSILDEYNFEPDPHASSLAMKREMRLAVVMPGTVNDHVFWDLPRSGVESALKELSALKVKTEILSFDQFDREAFPGEMEKLDLEKTDGVLFAPVFLEESLAFIRACGIREIPVVLINSLLEDPAVSSFVGQDAHQSGYLGAKLINYGLEYRKDVLVINMSARKDHHSHLIARERGFRKYFEDHGGNVENIHTLDVNGQDDQVLRSRLDEVFEAFRIGGIFVTNSRVYKVAEYLAGKGAMKIRLVGYDLLPGSVEYLQRDYIDFLISQRPELQAYTGLITLFNLVAFDRVPEARQMMPIDIISRENLKYYKH